MIWVFFGYASVACAALGVAVAVVLPADAKGDAILHLTIPFACMIALGAEAFVYGSPINRRHLKTVIVLGLIRRSTAYFAGVVAGAVVLVLHVALIQGHGVGSHAPIAVLLTSLVTLVLAPVAASAWLMARARSVLQRCQGFAVIHGQAKDE